LKRSMSVGLAVLLAAAILVAVAQAAVHQSADTKSTVATIKIGNTPAGAVLTSSTGHVLFIFAKDKRDKDACKPIKGCESDWPPVTSTAKPIAAKGVRKSLLGTIPYKGKLREVTYAGHPLHTYKHDGGAGLSFMDIGIKQYGAPWDALRASGKVVKAPSG
jgi:predicted lipoprotein with Yx(FWY)xxD motif